MCEPPEASPEVVEDEEEQLRPHQRRRTSPRRPASMEVVVADSPPAFLDEALGEALPLETGVDAPSTPTAEVGGEGPQGGSGPS